MKTIMQVTLVLFMFAMPALWAADTASKDSDASEKELKIVTINCDDEECQKICKSIEGDGIDLDAILKEIKADSSDGEKKVKVIVIKAGDTAECEELLKDLKVESKDSSEKKDATGK